MTDKRLIDANSLAALLIARRRDEPSAEAYDAYGQVMWDITQEETIDAVEVVHGQWILGVPITCSVCGKPAAEHDSPISFWESPYCPWCGAKMDGGVD